MSGDHQNHALSHLREWFTDWLEGNWGRPRGEQLDTTVEIGEDEPSPVALLLDALADCSDTLPRAYCDTLDLPPGSTYAQAIAAVRRCVS